MWARGYLRFLMTAVAVAATLALLGALPTARLGGPGAVPAMLAGCAAALLAAALGAVPIALAAGRPPAERLPAVLLGIVLRFFSVVLLGVAAVASGWFSRRPLVVWVAICYAAQLVVESRYAMRAAAA